MFNNRYNIPAIQFIKICNEVAALEQAGHQPVFEMLTNLQLSQQNTMPNLEVSPIVLDDPIVMGDGNSKNDSKMTSHDKLTNLGDTYYKSSFIKRSKDVVVIKKDNKKSINLLTSPSNKTL